MVIPAVLLVLLAIAVIRSLMEVVAHDDAAAPLSLVSDADATPAPLTGVWGDDVRSFLMPAATDDVHLERPERDVDANAS
jgi:hypothetical protein